MEIIRMVEDEPAETISGPEIKIQCFSTGANIIKRRLDWFLDEAERQDTRDSGENVRNEVDRRVRNYMAYCGIVDYEKALHAVFAENPDLKRRYAES